MKEVFAVTQPPIFDLVDAQNILGRQPRETIDSHGACAYLRGKTVLVTGAGGSIGSELCRQIVKHEPAELIMLDRDEPSLQDTQLSISGHGLLDTPDVVLADVRDESAIKDIFQARKPEVVFHAAALKLLPILEQYPLEAWKTNVLGSLNVFKQAELSGVKTLVNISTDKAVNPISVLGKSKKISEQLGAWFGNNTQMKTVSVRFGNVFASRGSIITIFRAQIAMGGPVTVTHPDMTRFFMTVSDACHLVLRAGEIGNTGEVLVLDMGEPVRVVDIAERMIRASGKEVEIIYTGLRKGEKLYEELIGVGEFVETGQSDSVSHVKIDDLNPMNLDSPQWLLGFEC